MKKTYNIDYVTAEDIVEIQFNTTDIDGDYPYMDTVQYKKEDYDLMLPSDIETMIDAKRTKWKEHMFHPITK